MHSGKELYEKKRRFLITAFDAFDNAFIRLRQFEEEA